MRYWIHLAAATLVLSFDVQDVRGAENTPATALKEYRRGNFKGAEAQYGELAKEDPNDPRLRFNAGAAAYRHNDLTNSAAWFESVLGSPDLGLQQQAYYNLGNTRFKLGERLEDPQIRKQLWGEALTNFSAAIKLRADDTNALANYAFVRKRLEELEQQQPPPPQQQQQQQSKDRQQQNQSSDLQNQEQNSKEPQDSDSKSESEKQSKDQDNSGQSAENQAGQDPADSSKPDGKDGDGRPDHQPEKSAGNEPGDQQKEEAGNKEKDATQASRGSDQSGSEGHEAGTEAQMAEERPGEMSAAQALRILEGQKNDEKALLLRAYGNGREAAERASRIRKPW